MGRAVTSLLDRSRAIVGAEPTRTARSLPYAVLFFDVAIITTTFIAAVVGRNRIDWFSTTGPVEETLGLAGPVLVVGWLATIAIAGGYQRRLTGSGTDEYKRVVSASLAAAGLTGVGCYLVKFDLSRGFFLLLFLGGVPALLLGRWTVRRVLHSARRHGYLPIRVLVTGTPSHVDEVTTVLRREPWLGYSVVGAVTPPESKVTETMTGVPVLGTCDELLAVAQQARADLIFFAAGSLGSGQEMKEILWDLESHNLSAVLAPKLVDISTGRLKVRPVGGLPLIHVEGSRWANASRLGKRTFDIVGSILLIAAATPLFALAAAQIWLHDRGPVLYRHRRVGRYGASFDCWKFRTMVRDADAQIARLLTAADDPGLLFKLKDDPRITKPGRWLRRFSVDELPQLFNVLRGDMSLVGPRPQVQREVALYRGGMSRRLLVRPGMTGLWQVSGRSDLSPAEAMRLDVFYVDNWSMLQDLAILARTFGAVLASRGAY